MIISKETWLSLVECIADCRNDFNKAVKKVSSRSEFDSIPRFTLRCIFWQENRHASKRLSDTNLDKLTSKCIGNKLHPGWLLATSCRQSMSPFMVAKQVKERLGIAVSDSHFDLEAEYASLADECNGPYSNAVKATIGCEYELKLKADLQTLGIPYVDEAELRHRGYDKTPDIKLDVPIMVNGRAVNWIESKALFGEYNVHKAYLKDQLWSYWNRFGSGLVIYWAGFVEEMNESASYAGILLSNDILSQKIETLDI